MFPAALFNQDVSYTRSEQFQSRQDFMFGRQAAARPSEAPQAESGQSAPRRDASPSAVFIRSERYESYQSSYRLSTGTDELYGPAETQKAQQPSEGALTASNNILSFIEAQLQRDLQDGATQEELESRLAAGLEGFEKGFAEAAQQLEEMGFLSDDIRADINQTRELVLAGVEELRSQFVENDEQAAVEQAPTAPVATSPQGSAQASGSLSSLSAYERSDVAQNNSFKFSLTTADGDKVTIDASSMRASVTQQYASYIPGVETLMQYSEAQSEKHQFSFSVVGELDEAELAAINDLLGQVNDLAETFFSGDLEGAFEQALEVGYDSTEISAFALNLSQTSVQRVTQAYEGVRDAGGGEAPALADRLQPLGGFVRDVLEALDTASNFQRPGDLLESLTEWFDRSEEGAFQKTVHQILEGLPAQSRGDD